MIQWYRRATVLQCQKKTQLGIRASLETKFSVTMSQKTDNSVTATCRYLLQVSAGIITAAVLLFRRKHAVF